MSPGFGAPGVRSVRGSSDFLREAVAAQRGASRETAARSARRSAGARLLRVSRWAGIVLLALPLAGCMERALLVRTDPPGARVWVNDVDRGTTPLRLRYVRDGRIRVRIEKPGYETVAEEVVTPTRIDAVPGPDFFFENGPGRHVRETTADYRLVPLAARPVTESDLEAVLRRGQAFGREAQAAAAEAGTPVPARPHDLPRATPAPAKPVARPLTPPPAPAPGAPAAGGADRSP